eukprot:TRINITY_DN12891_c0_g1_i1.p1 TRINITY_DN12891_c0_g1~~TRINITY_DN12891_c0_g1_i1.p1  ORF type:complete len:285 (-),score=69.73 TRINITY_DN12891_c0_g1_i1:86-940(-)
MKAIPKEEENMDLSSSEDDEYNNINELKAKNETFSDEYLNKNWMTNLIIDNLREFENKKRISKDFLKEENLDNLIQNIQKNVVVKAIKGALIRSEKSYYLGKDNFGGQLEMIVYNDLVVFQIFNLFEGQKQIYFDVNDVNYIGCLGYNLSGVLDFMNLTITRGRPISLAKKGNKQFLALLLQYNKIISLITPYNEEDTIKTNIIFVCISIKKESCYFKSSQNVLISKNVTDFTAPENGEDYNFVIAIQSNNFDKMFSLLENARIKEKFPQLSDVIENYKSFKLK